MRSLLTSAALIFALAIPTFAHADSFDFAFTTNTGISASGVFVTTDTEVGGYYTILSIDGTQTDGGVMGATTLLAPGSYGDNDNLFSTDFPFFDVAGATYSVGTVDYNIYNLNGIPTICDSNNEPGQCYIGQGVPIATGQLTATPEPSSLVLLGTGILSAAGAARRRFRKA